MVTRRAIILELSQNLSQICTLSSKRVLNCTQGDGYCDDANNVADCGFDLGDCCEYADTEDWDAFCQQCICKKP